MEKRLFLYVVALLALAFFFDQLSPSQTNIVTSNVVMLEGVTPADLTLFEMDRQEYTRDGVTQRFYLNCLNQACVVYAQEHGVRRGNRCWKDQDCIKVKRMEYTKNPTHKSCRKGRCVVIHGDEEPGIPNTCSEHADCRPTIAPVVAETLVEDEEGTEESTALVVEQEIPSEEPVVVEVEPVVEEQEQVPEPTGFQSSFAMRIIRWIGG